MFCGNCVVLYVKDIGRACTVMIGPNIGSFCPSFNELELTALKNVSAHRKTRVYGPSTVLSLLGAQYPNQPQSIACFWRN